MKTLITLFIFWLVWKVAKSAIEELQQRMRDVTSQQSGRSAPPVITPPRRESSQRAEQFPPAQFEGWPGGRTESGEEMSELERLFSEAMELKRRQSEAARQPQPRPQQPRTTYPRTARQRTAPRTVEPRVRPRRDVEVERARAARRREPVAAEQARERAEKPARPRRQKPAAARREAVREKRAPVARSIIGRLDKDDIRRSIVMAEVLGPPKALRDIDAHVI